MDCWQGGSNTAMIRALLLMTLLAALLCACGTAPKKGPYLTTPDGVTHIVEHPRALERLTNADGSLMSRKETKAVYAQYDIPYPKRALVWQCTAADAGSTAIGLSVGLSEANPLGWALIPATLIVNNQAIKAEKNGDPILANAVAVSRCGIAVINVLTILFFLL